MPIKDTAKSGYMQPFKKGTLIFKEHDQGAEMYILLQGSVEISTESEGRYIKLADIPRGGFFGEMSLLMEGHRRTATAKALSDCILMVITRNNFDEIVSRNPEVALRIMKGLAVRIRDLNNRLKEAAGPQADIPGDGEAAIGEIAADATQPCLDDETDNDVEKKAGGVPGAETEAEVNGDTDAGVQPDFSGDDDAADDESAPELSQALLDMYFFNKSITCPVCGNKFQTMVIRDSRLKQKERTNDLRMLYLDVEPLLYNIWVCPECYYAMRAAEFGKIDEIQKKNLANQTERRKEKYHLSFNTRRTLGFAVKAYRIAIECCDSLGKNKVDERIAALWLNLAWLYEDLKEADKAIEARKQALVMFKNAYMLSTGTGKSDQKIEYLIGKLSWDTGNVKEGREFMLKAASRRDGHPLIKELARDGLEGLKKAAE